MMENIEDQKPSRDSIGRQLRESHEKFKEQFKEELKEETK